MISSLNGQLTEKNPPTIVVDAGGVGYEVHVPMSTFYELPELGTKIKLLIQQVIREDAHLLYGFLQHAEREAFRQLVKVSGIGPRTALSVLSGMSVTELSQAISMQDAARITRVPGIGKKTAERLLLELKGKLGADLSGPAAITSDSQADILQALIALGYSDKEASTAVKGLASGVSVSDGIKQALRALAK